MIDFKQALLEPLERIGTTLLCTALLLLATILWFMPLLVSFLGVSSKIAQYLLIFLGGLLYTIVLGYFVEHLKSVASRRGGMPPFFSRIGEHFISGIKIGITLLLYYIPYFFLGFIPGIGGTITSTVYIVLMAVFLPLIIMNVATRGLRYAVFYHELFTNTQSGQYILAFIGSIPTIVVYGLVLYVLGILLQTVSKSLALIFPLYFIIYIFLVVIASLSTCGFFGQSIIMKRGARRR